MVEFPMEVYLSCAGVETPEFTEEEDKAFKALYIDDRLTGPLFQEIERPVTDEDLVSASDGPYLKIVSIPTTTHGKPTGLIDATVLEFKRILKQFQLPQDEELHFFSYFSYMNTYQFKFPFEDGYVIHCKGAITTKSSVTLSYRYDQAKKTILGVFIGNEKAWKTYTSNVRKLKSKLGDGLLPLIAMAQTSLTVAATEAKEVEDYYYETKGLTAVGEKENEGDASLRDYLQAIRWIDGMVECGEVSSRAIHNLLHFIENLDSGDEYQAILAALGSANEGLRMVVGRVHNRSDNIHATFMERMQWNISQRLLTSAKQEKDLIQQQGKTLDQTKELTEQQGRTLDETKKLTKNQTDTLTATNNLTNKISNLLTKADKASGLITAITLTTFGFLPPGTYATIFSYTQSSASVYVATLIPTMVALFLVSLAFHPWGRDLIPDAWKQKLGIQQQQGANQAEVAEEPTPARIEEGVAHGHA